MPQLVYSSMTTGEHAPDPALVSLTTHSLARLAEGEGEADMLKLVDCVRDKVTVAELVLEIEGDGEEDMDPELVGQPVETMDPDKVVDMLWDVEIDCELDTVMLTDLDMELVTQAEGEAL